mmetsp:Transcript_25696/g.29389  ORF Transcript_25696/g.29389 Transcript_25696/m.29389 type:complete len:339 (-) Transcript_25696:103-1119(-)
MGLFQSKEEYIRLVSQKYEFYYSESDVNAQNDIGNTLLMQLCFLGDVKGVKHLLSLYPGASLNIRNQDGNTALMLAVNHGEDLVMHLLKNYGNKIDINLQNKKGETVLMFLCLTKKQKSLQFVFDQYRHLIDFDVATANGNTILHILYATCAPELIVLVESAMEAQGANLRKLWGVKNSRGCNVTALIIRYSNEARLVYACQNHKDLVQEHILDTLKFSIRHYNSRYMKKLLGFCDPLVPLVHWMSELDTSETERTLASYEMGVMIEFARYNAWERDECGRNILDFEFKLSRPSVLAARKRFESASSRVGVLYVCGRLGSNSFGRLGNSIRREIVSYI